MGFTMFSRLRTAASALPEVLGRMEGTTTATPVRHGIERLEGRILLSAGDLDPAFGRGGIVLGGGGGGGRGGDAVAVLAGAQAGKVLTAGTDGGGRVRVTRYTAGGAVDRTFGGGT